MKRTSTALGTVFTLQMHAMEEASRQSRTEADLEHLFLAVLLSEQPAGRALRSLGITLEGARAAAEQLHVEGLFTLGVDASPPAHGITLYETQRGGDLTERAAAVMKAALEKKKQGDAAAVLRELLEEPSGMIEELLQRLGTDREQVRAALEATGPSSRAARRTGRDEVAGSRTVFVPAEPQEIWDVLIRPENIRIWDSSMSELEPEQPEEGVPSPGDGWTVPAGQTGTGRRPAPRRRGGRRRLVLSRADAPHLLEWEITALDRSAAESDGPGTLQRRTAELFAVPGGTELRFTVIWRRRARGPRRILRTALTPALRQLARLGAHSHATLISAHFR